MKLAQVLCLNLLLIAGSEGVSASELWPQWRGPNRDCLISQREWPAEFTGQLTEEFRVPLGDGYSGPIVSEERLFVTESTDGKEIVRALDRNTGGEVWKKEWTAKMSVPFFAAANGSWIRSTPVLARDRLIVASMEDVLVCLSVEDGSELWRFDFRKQFETENQSFGFVCSPVVWNDFVYVQVAAGLVKLSVVNGEMIWRALSETGGMMGGAFSSPVIAEIHGREQLIVLTRAKMCGVSPETGDELWSVDVPAFRGMNILTPVVVGHRIFTSSYGGGSFLFEIKEEDDGGYMVQKVWENKVEAYMSSPVVVDGKIYLHLRNQRMTCLDLETGETVWTSTPFGKYWSMVVNGRQALVLDERGDVLHLELTPDEFRKLSSRHISESPTWGHIAAADRQVFIREQNAVVAYRW
ncbi:MAG: PQQ-binding-like beta-propeller repeat protein [Planctomycetaceae bacterium]